ncbi:Zinc finger CCCH domain-containing protein 3 [Mytilus coruscus]|uniref:Zinc finger CCCH domain-containing protein 3 n=1 Tax=Mytilus coruscus TaxID=42192 RepID=A0A6J8CCX3_MYTCO|nr:Zinc finger CCCH domain-containing protein 3 [Mytilus coruscus]
MSTFNTSGTEQDILKRQIRYLTDLINTTAGSSKHREVGPNTSSKLLHKHDKDGRQSRHVGNTGKESVKDSSKFYWKKTNIDYNVAQKKTISQPCQHQTMIHRSSTTGTQDNKEINGSLRRIQSTLSFPSTSQKAANHYSNQSSQKLSLRSHKSDIHISNKISKPAQVKNSTEENTRLKNDMLKSSYSVPLDKNLPSEKCNENMKMAENFVANDRDTSSLRQNECVLQRLRKHPFMNRSKNQTLVQTHPPYEKIDVASTRLCSDSISDLKPSQTKFSDITGHAGSHFVKPNFQDSKSYQGSVDTVKSTCINKPKEISKSKKSAAVSQIPDGKQTRTKSSSSEISPSKKEMMEELNRKLSETSDKISALKRQLSFKSIISNPQKTTNTKKHDIVVRNEVKTEVTKDLTNETSGTIQNQQKNYINTNSTEKVVHDLSGLNPESACRNSDSKSADSFTYKSRFSLQKSLPMETPVTCNPLPTKTGIRESFVKSIKTSKMPFKSKYKLRKNVSETAPPIKPKHHQVSIDSKHKIQNNLLPGQMSNISGNVVPESFSSDNVLLKSSRSQTTNMIKSKYKLQKVCSSKSSSNDLSLSHCSQRSMEGNQNPVVFKSKFKIRKQNSQREIMNHCTLTNSNTQVASNIIKSKYKLRKIGQNTSSTLKLTANNKKPVFKSQFKFNDMPTCTSTAGVESGQGYSGWYHKSSGNSWHQTRNQFYGPSSQRRKKFPSMISYHWNGYHDKSRNKSKYNYNNQWIHSVPHKGMNWTSKYRLGTDRNLYKYNRQGNTAKSPLLINKRYVLKRLQMTTKSPSNYKKVHTIKNSKDNMKMVVINGMLYKSSGHSLVKTNQQKTNNNLIVVKKMNTSAMKIVKVRGIKFQMDTSGKTLKRMDSSPVKIDNHISRQVFKSSVNRIDIGGMTYIQTKPGTLEQVGSNKSKVIASRVKHRSILTAAAKYKKDNTKKKVAKKYCMFFNRFGKCERGSNCPFVHDPDRVAVCTRFLRGTCKVDDCLFSHKVAKEKMPTCSYFLRGLCNRDDCPYLHVNVSKTAKVCQDFIKGFCHLGEKCTKKHTTTCPSYSKTGVCSEVKPCKLKHIKRKQRNVSLDGTDTGEKDTQQKLQSKRRHEEEITDESDIPFKQRKLPAFISILSEKKEKSEDAKMNEIAVSAIKIRPQLG